MQIELDKIETEQIPLEEEIKTEDNEQPKKRRGRPRKNTIENEQNISQVKIDFSFIYSIIIDRLPNKIALSENEKESLNDVTNKLAEKYLPLVAGYDVEISFLLVVGSVLIPRLQKPNEQNETIEQTETKE